MSADLLVALMRHPVSASLRPWQITYNINVLWRSRSEFSTWCRSAGPFCFRGTHGLARFGIGNLAVVANLAFFTVDGLASLWCVYAAVSSGAIALEIRFANSHTELPA